MQVVAALAVRVDFTLQEEPNALKFCLLVHLARVILFVYLQAAFEGCAAVKLIHNVARVVLMELVCNVIADTP